MKIGARIWILTGVVMVAATALADTPHIGFVFPAGGQQGTTFAVELGGQFLKSADAVVVTGDGVSARVMDYRKFLTMREIGQARNRQRNLTGQLGDENKTEAQKERLRKQLERVDALLAMQDPARLRKKKSPELREREAKRQLNPQLSERLVLEVTVDAEAADGERELRVTTEAGVSNPIFFHVGTLKEATETEPNDDHMTADLQEVSLPVLLNGQIMPGDMDHCRFKAEKGDQLVVDVSARKLIPYLADAVPGWFQATLALFDEEGNEVAFADDYKFNPDPVLFYDVPKSGTYTLQIRDSIYRGREDFVYRISVGKLPFITSIFPLGWQKGEPVEISLEGKNLPTTKISGQLLSQEQKVKQVSLKKDGIRSNPVSFVVSEKPEQLEVEPNDKEGAFQQVTFPVVINGRIQSPDDRDVYCFTGTAGQNVSLEVHARRLNSPLDSVLRLYDSQWNELASNDDYVDKTAGLVTHHADSYLVHTLPADGTYYLVLADTQQHGSEEHAYRLRMETAVPDFELRLDPSAMNIAPGGSAMFTAHAVRKGGFDGEIELKAFDLPRGFTMSQAVIREGSDKVRFTITAGEKAFRDDVHPRIEGSARTSRGRIKREAQAADDQMQAFLYRHLVPADELVLAPAETALFRFEADLSALDLVKLPLNKEVSIPIDVFRIRRYVLPVQLVLDNPPEGITLISGTIDKGARKGNVVLKASAPLEPGFEDNLILKAEIERGQQKAVYYSPAFPIRVVNERQTGFK